MRIVELILVSSAVVAAGSVVVSTRAESGGNQPSQLARFLEFMEMEESAGRVAAKRKSDRIKYAAAAVAIMGGGGALYWYGRKREEDAKKDYHANILATEIPPLLP